MERVTDVARRVVRDGLRGRIPTLDPGHQPPGLGLGSPKVDHGPDGAPAGEHPTLEGGDPGVDRTSGSDPGHS